MQRVTGGSVIAPLSLLVSAKPITSSVIEVSLGVHYGGTNNAVREQR